jgi:hypothetical protein
MVTSGNVLQWLEISICGRGVPQGTKSKPYYTKHVYKIHIYLSHYTKLIAVMKLLKAFRVLGKILYGLLCADAPYGSKRSGMNPNYFVVHNFIALLLSLIFC